MWFSRDRDTVEAIEARALSMLDEGRSQQALSAAEQLLAMGWSGGFEIKALALKQHGRIEAAIDVLEEGVGEAPEAWSLWQLLGNLRSDAGRLDEALEALDAALAIDGVAEASARFNRAIVQHRRGEPGEALDDLEPILALPRPPAFAEDALSLAARCLAEIGRAEEGLGLIETAADACGEEDPRWPRLEAERAVALDRVGRDPREAYERATETGVTTPDLLALGRRLDPVTCEAPKRFHLVVHAAVDRERQHGDDVKGLFRILDVVAGDPQQALALATRTLPVYARGAAEIEEHRVTEDPIDLEPGVHSASGLVFYAED